MKTCYRLLTFCCMLFVLLFSFNKSYAASYNYAEALQKAIYFYECQQAGPLPDWNRVEWRGDATMNDFVTGGWYDAGDHVKFNLPMSYSASMLGWALYEYGDGIDAVGQKTHLENNLKFVLDYLVDCDLGSSMVYQVGDGGQDHSWWGPVEVIEKEMVRPYYSTSQASCVAGQSAAALAIGYILFKNSSYLSHAKNYFNMAYSAQSDSGYTAASGYYNSWSGYWDELLWSAIWLHIATGDQDYLDQAESFVANLNNQGQTEYIEYKWGHCWDDSHYAAMVLLARLTGKQEYHDFVQMHLDWWTPTGFNGESINYTPGGLAWLDSWGALRYATTAAFLASVYADSITDTALKTKYQNFAQAQIDYALGSNPGNRSYVVGFGNNAPEHPHHRTSHGSWADSQDVPAYHRHILYGALVGGPNQSDSYTDDISDYVCNEVATDYNAGFVAMLAKMCSINGGTPLSNFPASEQKEDEFFVETKLNSSANNYSEIRAYLNNRSGWPARMIKDLSFNYYMDLSEVFDAGASLSDITIAMGYKEFPAKISSLQHFSGNIYYVKITLEDGTNIYPGGQSEYAAEFQFRIETPHNSVYWDPTNDYSYQAVGSDIVKNPYITVYDGGKLIYGNEPGPVENKAPVAADDSAITIVDTAVAIDILANDVDTDGVIDTSSVTITDAPDHGTVSVNPSTGVATYTPASGYLGTDSFKYTVADDEAAVSNESTVTITVKEEQQNIPPVASDDTDSTIMNNAVTTAVLANDSDVDGTLDASSVTITAYPQNGTVSVNSVTGEVVYTPDTDFVGEDNYCYTVKDNAGDESNEATVTITVTEQSGDYTVSFDVPNDWVSGFTGNIIIANTGTTTIRNWTLSFDFDRQIDQFWTAVIVSHSGDHYVITCHEWNSVIEPGQSLLLGFNGTPGSVNEGPENFVLEYE